MTVIDYITITGPLSTSSTEWDEIGNRSFGVDHDGETYKLFGYCEYTSGDATGVAEIHLVLNGAEVCYDHFSPEADGAYRVFNAFGVVTLNIGYHLLSLQARTDNASNATSVRRIRLLVEKF